MSMDLKDDHDFEYKPTEYGLNDDSRKILLDSLQENSNSQFVDLFLPLHPADQADFISGLASFELREKLINIVGANIDAQVLTYLENEIKNEVIELLGVKVSAKAINELEVDDAVQVVEDLEDNGLNEILNYVSDEKRTEIEEALSYDESSIGRIMHQNFVAVKKDWSVGQATSFIQEKNNLPDDFHYIVVVDDNFSPISEVLVSKLIQSKKNTLISEIMSDGGDLKKISTSMEQEEVARLFGKYSLTYAPIIDQENHLVGVIYSNDLFRLLEEQNASALYDFAGISDEESITDRTYRKVYLRYKWLIINLITAFFAAFTVGIFKDTISAHVLLAVYMPIVAGMGGNAATQTLAVMVRGIALRQASFKNCWPILKRELGSSAINGFINGLIVFFIVMTLNKDFKIAVILAIAMILNLMVAALFGTIVPLIMKHFGKDPATSATIFITTATDVLGFLSFLGLAAIIL